MLTHQCRFDVIIRSVFCQMLLNGTYWRHTRIIHYTDNIMSAMASQITSFTIAYRTVYLGVDQRKDQSSASLAFVWGIQPRPVNSPHKRPVTWKMCPFDDVIMYRAAEKDRRWYSWGLIDKHSLNEINTCDTRPMVFDELWLCIPASNSTTILGSRV